MTTGAWAMNRCPWQDMTSLSLRRSSPTTMNFQGWRLLPEGAMRAASSTRSSTAPGIGLFWNWRTLRLVLITS